MSYKYRLHNADGSDAGEITLAVRVQPDEIIHRGPDQPALRILDVVYIDESTSPYKGLLRVEPAD